MMKPIFTLMPLIPLLLTMAKSHDQLSSQCITKQTSIALYLNEIGIGHASLGSVDSHVDFLFRHPICLEENRSTFNFAQASSTQIQIKKFRKLHLERKSGNSPPQAS